MSLFRNLFSIAVGAAVGCVATLVLQQYEREQEDAADCVYEYKFDHEHTEGPEADAAEAPNAAPAPEPAAPVQRETQQPGTPNVNPVADVADAPRTANGKVDPSTIASPEDFADWDQYGCQG